VLAGVVAAREAVDRARAGKGPTLIELVTYRLGPHTTADDARRYRRDEEVELWKPRDPLIRTRKYLEKKGLWNQAWQDELEAEIQVEIEENVRAAETELAQVDPLEVFDHIYAEKTPDLQAQKEAAAEFVQVQVEHH
jgi:TPP-dependent pyruvate/acetoin dehydrogenase alpha subunit